MTNYKPPGRQPGESRGDQFRRVYNERVKQPSDAVSEAKRPRVAYRAGQLFAALLTGTALLCLLGVMVWLVKWISNML